MAGKEKYYLQVSLLKFIRDKPKTLFSSSKPTLLFPSLIPPKELLVHNRVENE